ncbi:SWR1 complex subunit 6 [Pelomyxa schiedti]|nr:SWR1 complex subunit 6 [Pelomyxa schiedti]
MPKGARVVEEDRYKQTPEPTELPPTQTPRTPPTTGVNSQEQGKDDLSNCTLSSNSTENVDKGPLSKETPITDIVDKGPLSTLAISSPQPVADDEMVYTEYFSSSLIYLAEKPKVLNLYPTLCPALGTINVESQGESQEIPPTPTKPTASSVAPSTPSSQSSRNKTTSTPLRSSKKKRPPTTKKGTAPTPHPPAPNHAATSGAIPLLSFASLPLSSLSSISIPSTPSTHSGQSTVSSALASTSTVNVAPSPSPGLPSSGMRAAAVAAAAAIASPNLHAQPHAIFPHMRFTRTQRNRTLERLEAENDPADKEKVDTMVEDSDNIGGSSSEEDETFKLSSSQKASQSKKHRGRRMSSATAIPGLDKRRVRGFMTLLDESAFESPGNHAPSYLNAAARPSALPKRHFCVMCGFFAPYTCTKCGLRYCCHKCNQQHLETRCNKTVH